MLMLKYLNPFNVLLRMDLECIGSVLVETISPDLFSLMPRSNPEIGLKGRHVPKNWLGIGSCEIMRKIEFLYNSAYRKHYMKSLFIDFIK